MVGAQSFSDKAVSKVKSTYYYFEDKWYGTLDKIDPKVPVYKIIDPIDEVIPSFILFLLCILFLFILAGYLIQFTTPYTMTFKAYDSESKDSLQNVALNGLINDTDFDIKTNSRGIAETDSINTNKNLYELLGQMLLGGSDSFSGKINATKDGYVSIRRLELENATTQTIHMEPNPVIIEFLGQAQVSLYDDDSQELILDSDNGSLIKFSCDNKTTLPKSVRDGTDGSIDGVFNLVEDNCDFVLTYANADGYEREEPSTKISTIQLERVYLTKQETNLNGTARITVTDNNNTLLEGININFAGINGVITTDATGIARKQLLPGKYNITITDQNYYSITPDHNIFIEITTGNLISKTIVLRRKSLSDSRKIFLKVIDSNNQVVSNANTHVFWLRTDGNTLTNISAQGSVAPYTSGVTDANGLFELQEYSVEDEGKLIVEIDKEEYILTHVFPVLKKLTNRVPQIVTITKATESNSGNAIVITQGGDNNRPINHASAYIVSPIIVDGNTLNLAYSPKDTNLSGMAEFNRLPPGNYFAGAKYKSVSGVAPLKGIDFNQVVFFKIHLDMNLAELEVILVDSATGQILSTQNEGSVKVYSYDSDPAVSILYESLIFRGNKFKNNNGYDIEDNFIIEAKLDGYVKRTIQIDGSSNPLIEGVNYIEISLFENITNGRGNCNGSWMYSPQEEWVCITNIPTCPENKYKLDASNNLVCSTTCSGQWIAWETGFACYPSNFPYSANGSIGIFYDTVYDTLKTAEWGQKNTSSNMLQTGNEYYTKFNTVIFDENLTYQELYSMTRLSGADIESLFEYSNLQDGNMMKDVSCKTENLDGANIRDHNYYFPTCSEDKKEQSAIKWFSSNLEPKQYDFINKLKITSDTNELVTINYRASEKDNDSFFETPLLTKEIIVGKLLTTGFAATIKLDLETTIFNFESNPTISVDLDYETTIPLEIVLHNNTTRNMNDGIITVYSHSGNINNFSLNSNGSGTLNFDNNSPKEIISSNATVPKHETSDTYSTTVTTTGSHSSNYLIILIEIDDEEYVAIYDTATFGTRLNLDTEFLSGVNNPKLYGAIYPVLPGQNPPEIKSVTIMIDENCDAGPSSNLNYAKIESTYSNPTITENVFTQVVAGVFTDHEDCAWISVTPKPSLANHYQKIENKKVWASPSGAFDPNLACIQIQDESGNTEITMNWNTTTNINVVNTCTRQIRFRVESGVFCNTDNGACNNPSGFVLPGINAGSGEANSKEFRLIGKNLSYNENDSPNFSDKLGIFPVYVKAKYTDEPRKKYNLADTFYVHLKNDGECFSISNDDFDMTEVETSDFYITNNCQDTSIADHQIPQTTLNSFGYDINSNKPIESGPVSFDINLVINGTQYGTTEVVTPVLGFAWKNSIKDFNNLPISQIISQDENINKYPDLEYVFDLNDIIQTSDGQYIITDIQIGVIDVNNHFIDINTPYGATIVDNVILTYDDNSTKTITSRNNLNIIPNFSCQQVANMHCITGNNLGEGAAFNDLIFGTFYLDLESSNATGKIKSVKLSFLGNENPELLKVGLTPVIDYNTFHTVVDNSDVSTNEEELSLGNFTVYPSSIVNAHIKDLRELTAFSTTTFIDKDNPQVSVKTENDNILVWIVGESLKARYVGNDYAGDNNKSLNRILVKKDAKGNTYSLVNVIDYVNTIIADATGRRISGDTQ
jgi:hypothetical protein